MAFDTLTILYLPNPPAKLPHPSKKKGSEGGPWRSRHVRERAGLQALRSLGNLERGHRGGITWYHHVTSKMSIESIEHDLRIKHD